MLSTAPPGSSSSGSFLPALFTEIAPKRVAKVQLIGIIRNLLCRITLVIPTTTQRPAALILEQTPFILDATTFIQVAQAGQAPYHTPWTLQKAAKIAASTTQSQKAELIVDCERSVEAYP